MEQDIKDIKALIKSIDDTLLLTNASVKTLQEHVKPLYEDHIFKKKLRQKTKGFLKSLALFLGIISTSVGLFYAVFK